LPTIIEFDFKYEKSISIFYFLILYFINSISVFSIILFLFYFLDSMATCLPDLLDFHFWRHTSCPCMLLLSLYLGLEYFISGLFKTGVVILNLYRIVVVAKIIQVLVPSSLVHHWHWTIQSIIHPEAKGSHIFFTEITLLLHLLNSKKHCSFLWFGLSSYGETSFKHFFLFIHKFFSTLFI